MRLSCNRDGKVIGLCCFLFYQFFLGKLLINLKTEDELKASSIKLKDCSAMPLEKMST